jgi:hypothetical protein
VTDAGLAMLAGPDSKTVETLKSIDISGCQAISNQVTQPVFSSFIVFLSFTYSCRFNLIFKDTDFCVTLGIGSGVGTYKERQRQVDGMTEK